MRSILAISLLAGSALAYPATVLKPREARAEVIPGEYVVTLKSGTTDDVDSFIKAHNLSQQPDRKFEIDAFKGFSIVMTDDEATALEADPAVESVESDRRIPVFAITNQQSSSWGLPKLSQGTGAASSTYTYDDSAGEGTCSYIIDTGVTVSHPDFEGRAIFGINYEPTDGSDDDLNGHGTFNAGVIGSKTYGVAKKTKIISVKACNAQNTCRYQDIVAGLSWITQDSKTRDCPKGTVVNLSLGGWGNWVAVKSAATAATNNGLFLAVASGNDGQDAQDIYPASAPNACTVSATDRNNNFASFSNFGSVIDILAPGVQITSTSRTGGYTYMSGTSMAAPHIAGLGAYLLALEGASDPVALCQKMKDRALKNVVQGVPAGTANLLAFNAASGTPSIPSTPSNPGAAAGSNVPGNNAPSNGSGNTPTEGSDDVPNRGSGRPANGGFGAPIGGSNGGSTTAPGGSASGGTGGASDAALSDALNRWLGSLMGSSQGRSFVRTFSKTFSWSSE